MSRERISGGSSSLGPFSSREDQSRFCKEKKSFEATEGPVARAGRGRYLDHKLHERERVALARRLASYTDYQLSHGRST
jgi:hypothetical protein